MLSRFAFLSAAFIALLVRPGAEADDLTKAEVAKLGKAASVFVLAKTSSGSGFCVHPSGLFITNAHVVGADGEVTVVLNASLKDQKVLKAKVLRSDRTLDLALLQVEGQKDLPTLALGSIDKLSELTEVITCGFPFGKDLQPDKNEYPSVSIAAGSINALRMKGGELDQIQLDAELNPGNSGGPVLDLNGKVVGVAAKKVAATRVSFAIPVTQLAKFLDKPDILFTPPVVGKLNVHEPIDFQAKLASVLPTPKPFDLELVLRAGDEPGRRFPMKLKDGTYRVSAVPVPKEVGQRLLLAAQFETGAVEGIVEDRDIQVGPQKSKWSACKRIQLQPKPVVFLTDGKTLDGLPTGLEKVAVLVGGQTLTVDLTKATSLQFQLPKPVAAVECTLIVRQDGKEVGRSEHRLSVEGVNLVAPADLTGTGIVPPKLGAEKVIKKLPDVASDICVGGGGRYLILNLPKLKKLAIFDVTEATIVRYIPLTEDKVVCAAGLDKVVVGLCKKGVLESWDLATGEKVASSALPDGAEVKSVIMGSASHGPVVVNAVFYDLDTLKPLPLKSMVGGPVGRDPASADGTVFGHWNTNLSPGSASTFVFQGNDLKRYEEGQLGHVVPGPDGQVVYTGSGPRTYLLKGVSGAPKAGYSLPAVEGNLFLTVTTAEGTSAGSLSVYLLGNEQPLVKDAGVPHGIHFDGWDREEFGPWKRLYLIPRANLIVVFPDGNDRLELYPFNVEAALEKSGLNYLLVTSQPPRTAKRGAEFAYQITTKSKKGDVKYTLSSGPPGMEVSATGSVKWRVPADFKGAADVLITVRDASGQEAFHTFIVRITDG